MYTQLCTIKPEDLAAVALFTDHQPACADCPVAAQEAGGAVALLTETIKNNLEREMQITSAALSRSKGLLKGIDRSPDEQLSNRAKLYCQMIESPEKQYQQSGRILAGVIEAFSHRE